MGRKTRVAERRESRGGEGLRHGCWGIDAPGHNLETVQDRR